MKFTRFKAKEKDMETNKVKLSAPWVIYYRQIEALFGVDPEVSVEFDEEALEIKLKVEDASKADAIAQLLPASKNFGNVDVTITVIPANADNWKAHIIQKAFKNSPVLEDIQIVQTELMSNPMCFVIFKKEVVQYYSDNAGDYHGLTSTLYQDIAKELIPAEGVYYCTDNNKEV